jgi:hypothetical protein
VNGQDPFLCSRQECDNSVGHLYKWALRKIHFFVVRQECDNSVGHLHKWALRKIHFFVVRQECDNSVGHLHKWALREVERCVLSAAPGQPKEEKKHHDTIADIIAASSHVLSSTISRRVPYRYMAVGYLLFLQELIKDIIIGVAP